MCIAAKLRTENMYGLSVLHTILHYKVLVDLLLRLNYNEITLEETVYLRETFNDWSDKIQTQHENKRSASDKLIIFTYGGGTF